MLSPTTAANTSPLEAQGETCHGKEDEKESGEPDYDEDKDQLEEEQEEKTGETTNQIF
jgi:hypothetical protein